MSGQTAATPQQRELGLEDFSSTCIVYPLFPEHDGLISILSGTGGRGKTDSGPVLTPQLAPPDNLIQPTVPWGEETSVETMRPKDWLSVGGSFLTDDYDVEGPAHCG